MTTTDPEFTETVVAGELPPLPEQCPTCGRPGVKAVEGTTIWHCDKCGQTGDLATGELVTPPEPDAVQADEVHAPGEAPSALPAIQGDPHAAGMLSDISFRMSASEWEQMAAEAVMMAASHVVPKALYNKPNDVWVVLRTGRDLGLPVTTALRMIHVIDGTPSLSPKLRIARVHMLNLGDIVRDPMQEADRRYECTALALSTKRCALCQGTGLRGTRNGEPVKCSECRSTGYKIRERMTFTWEDARGAGMVKPDCTPDLHVCRGDPPNRCKDNWRKYPARMLWWRASGYLADDVFPEAGLGLYSADELGAVTDAEGEVITIDNVELPEGFEDVRTTTAELEPEVASPELRAELATRISFLPEKHQNELRAAWIAKGDERGLTPLTRLESRHVAVAIALIEQAYRNAEAEGWTPPPPGDAPVSPEPPKTPPCDDDADDASEATAGKPAPSVDDLPDYLREQLGKAQAEVTEAILNTAIAAVQAMPAKVVNEALNQRDMSTDGLVADRRVRLANQMAKETAYEYWSEANRGAE